MRVGTFLALGILALAAVGCSKGEDAPTPAADTTPPPSTGAPAKKGGLPAPPMKENG